MAGLVPLTHICFRAPGGQAKNSRPRNLQHIGGLFRDNTFAADMIGIRLIMRLTHPDALKCGACGHGPVY